MVRKIAILLVLFSSMIADVHPATLTWDANSDAEYYVIYVRPVGGTDWTVIGDQIRGTSWEVPNMAIYNDDYEFTIKCFNACGNSSDYATPITYNQCVQGVVDAVVNMKLVIEINTGTRGQ